MAEAPEAFDRLRGKIPSTPSSYERDKVTQMAPVNVPNCLFGSTLWVVVLNHLTSQSALSYLDR